MKKIIVMLAVMLSLTLATNAQDTMGAKKKAAKPKNMTLTGNLIDKMCSAKNNTAETAMEHKKGCSLSERCANSGFGVFADGKYYEFDEAGNGLAKSSLEKSTAEKGAMFKVTGMVAENKMTVTKISEVVAKKKS